MGDHVLARGPSMGSIICPKCQAKLKLDDNAPRHQLVCPRCRRLLRLSEEGAVSISGESKAGKQDSGTVRLAGSERRRHKGEKVSGWIVYGAIGGVVCLLLGLLWLGTSGSNKPKKPAPAGAPFGFEQSQQPEIRSMPAEPAEPAEPTEPPAVAEASRATPSDRRPLDKPKDADTSGSKSNSSKPRFLLPHMGETTASSTSRADSDSTDGTVRSANGKTEPPSKSDNEEQAPAVGQPVDWTTELADVLSGKVGDDIAKILEDWQTAAANFALEKSKTTDPESLKSLSKRDPSKEFASKLLEFGEERPTSKTGFQAFVVALYVVRDSDTDVTGNIIVRATKHLGDHFGTPGMGKVALMASTVNHSAVRRLIQTVLDKSPHRDDRGLACYSLIANLKIERDQTSEPAASKRIEKQALSLVRRIEKQEFGDVTVHDLPLLDALKQLAASSEKKLALGSPAPEIVGKDLDGKNLKLSDYHGKVVMLEFWASWCPYCRNLVPYERELVNKMKRKPFVLLGVNVDKRSAAATVQRKFQLNWRSWQDGPSGPIGAKYHIRGYPTVILLDRKGTVRYAGYASNPEFYDQVIKDLLAERDGRKGKDEANDDSKSASRD
jgi:thiol-disulfide isomerase/thioredoxin